MVDLNTWLDTADPTDGANWTLEGAIAITDTDLITGYGLYNDGVTSGTFAFLLDASGLTVPEPSSLPLLVFAGAMLLRRR